MTHVDSQLDLAIWPAFFGQVYAEAETVDDMLKLTQAPNVFSSFVEMALGCCCLWFLTG